MLTDPRRLIASLIVPLWLLVLPTDAVAQTEAPQPLSMERQLAASAPVSLWHWRWTVRRSVFGL